MNGQLSTNNSFESIFVPMSRKSWIAVSLAAVTFFNCSTIPAAFGSTKKVVSLAQVKNAIKNLKAMDDKNEADYLIFDTNFDRCFNAAINSETGAPSPDESCRGITREVNREKVDSDYGRLQNDLYWSQIAAKRVMKSKSNFEADFVLAINFEFLKNSFSFKAQIPLSSLKANQVAEVARAQNLYQEGNWIAENYSPKSAKAYMAKAKEKIDYETAKTFLALFRKAAFAK